LLFGAPRALIGVIHVGALKNVAEIADEAVGEARVYEAAGFHRLAIENTHDRPYLKSSVGPEIGAAMAVVGFVVRRGFHSPWEFRFSQGPICGLSPSHTRAARALFEWRVLFSPT
jgi:predicted TIM-barrel enzyme